MADFSHVQSIQTVLPPAAGGSVTSSPQNRKASVQIRVAGSHDLLVIFFAYKINITYHVSPSLTWHGGFGKDPATYSRNKLKNDQLINYTILGPLGISFLAMTVKGNKTETECNGNCLITSGDHMSIFTRGRKSGRPDRRLLPPRQQLLYINMDQKR
jgi:hypothetical protein